MDSKLDKEIKTYIELAQKDKSIDVASLMISALNKGPSNLLSTREKRWAYLISVGVPPFGLIFALKFYFSDTDDGKQSAYICVGLTVASIIFLVIISRLLFAGSGIDTNQVQQLQTKDFQDLLQ
jgi:hypothetical protein